MKKKIIVVEDDPFSQNFYSIILNKSGFEPIILENADEVINRINTDNISIIIMDINLKNTYFQGKKIDGSILSKMIKADDKLSIPILIITAFSPSIKGNTFFEESLADDFIIKPIIDYNTLLQKINELINKYGK
ncbi:MAG: response regulator [Ignavibacteriaceae bacterium]